MDSRYIILGLAAVAGAAKFISDRRSKNMEPPQEDIALPEYIELKEEKPAQAGFLKKSYGYVYQSMPSLGWGRTDSAHPALEQKHKREEKRYREEIIERKEQKEREEKHYREQRHEQEQKRIHEQDRLNLTKEQFLRELKAIPLPQQLQCQYFDFEPLNNPVISPLGHCYSRVNITKWLDDHKTCPGTNTPLSQDQLFDYLPLTTLINTFKDKYLQMQTAINHMTIDKANQIDTWIHMDYRKSLNRYANEMDLIQQRFRTSGYIIYKLQLDINNIDHLRYWHNQTRKCFYGKGGVEIIHRETGTKFRVPTRIKKMMQTATRNFPTEEALLAALNVAKNKKPGLWNNPFSSITRKTQTSSVYAAPNLKTFNILR